MELPSWRESTRARKRRKKERTTMRTWTSTPRRPWCGRSLRSTSPPSPPSSPPCSRPTGTARPRQYRSSPSSSRSAKTTPPSRRRASRLTSATRPRRDASVSNSTMPPRRRRRRRRGPSTSSPWRGAGGVCWGCRSTRTFDCPWETWATMTRGSSAPRTLAGRENLPPPRPRTTTARGISLPTSEAATGGASTSMPLATTGPPGRVVVGPSSTRARTGTPKSSSTPCATETRSSTAAGAGGTRTTPSST
mmetsp:Transcript_41136/g.87666  ORF Transcript_41136/g.87666 Transcript_41136/m.87666 type:complete len:249 (+) Transcript_41136:1317-2063(+)